jgi:hypothetical protein
VWDLLKGRVLKHKPRTSDDFNENTAKENIAMAPALRVAIREHGATYGPDFPHRNEPTSSYSLNYPTSTKLAA